MESTAKNGDEGYSTWPGGAGGNEEDGRSRSGSNINSKETKWNIQTESERYINSLGKSAVALRHTRESQSGPGKS